jgi:hypothetical protein
MAKYQVTLTLNPVISASVQVEAESEEQALAKAREAASAVDWAAEEIQWNPGDLEAEVDDPEDWDDDEEEAEDKGGRCPACGHMIGYCSCIPVGDEQESEGGADDEEE